MTTEVTNEETIIDPNVVDATLEATTTEETTTEETTIVDETAGAGDALEATTTEEITPEYIPTLKYKVRDEEHDMDAWVKDLVKDEDTEKKFMDLYTAKHGLELAKTEREEYRGKFENLESAVVHVSKLANEGKIDRFIEELGLPKKAFIDYAINELKYNELPEEQKREVDAQKQQELYLEQQSMQNAQLQQQYEAQQVEMRRMELNSTLMKPEYAEAERVYDQSVGAPGSFKNLVAQCGNYHWNQTGRDIGVDQAVQEAIRLGRVNVEANPIQTGNVGIQDKPVLQQEKPVIPNFKAGGASPARKAFTSVDEIRKYNANRG